MFEDLIARQEKVLLEIAREIVPGITLDDIWQPNDFPLLEENPYFRYEEGVLHGILSARAFFLSQKADRF